MKIEICELRSDGESFETVRDIVQSAALDSLDSLACHIVKVDVYLGKKQRPGQGTSNTICMLEARLRGGTAIAFIAEAPSVRAAVVEALGKLRETLVLNLRNGLLPGRNGVGRAAG